MINHIELTVNQTQKLSLIWISFIFSSSLIVRFMVPCHTSFRYTNHAIFCIGLPISIWRLLWSWSNIFSNTNILCRITGLHPHKLQNLALPGFTIQKCSFSRTTWSERYLSRCILHLWAIITILRFQIFQLNRRRITKSRKVLLQDVNLKIENYLQYINENTGTRANESTNYPWTMY